MKLTMISVKVRGKRYTGFIMAPTARKGDKIIVTWDTVRKATGAPLSANLNDCVEIGG